jgi:alkanesulfonate monooxygenase SsuD/methylene tetrahydromethanopterin reductase-like flavin-dependent oxidoreductase (luciferase family)
MRFSYAEAMCDPSRYLPLARAAEDAGYHGFVVPDNRGFPGMYPMGFPHTHAQRGGPGGEP